MITAAQLVYIMHFCPLERAQRYEAPINDACVAFGIDQTPQRQAAFIAQVAQESGELKYAAEISSGEQYESRADLGNTQPGDGPKFKGRGLLEVTGRLNYSNCSLALYGDYRLIDTPEMLEQPYAGAAAAGWYWQSHALSPLADSGDFVTLTKRINGGTNGLTQRLIYWKRAKEALGLQ